MAGRFDAKGEGKEVKEVKEQKDSIQEHFAKIKETRQKMEKRIERIDPTLPAFDSKVIPRVPGKPFEDKIKYTSTKKKLTESIIPELHLGSTITESKGEQLQRLERENKARNAFASSSEFANRIKRLKDESQVEFKSTCTEGVLADVKGYDFKLDATAAANAGKITAINNDATNALTEIKNFYTNLKDQANLISEGKDLETKDNKLVIDTQYEAAKNCLENLKTKISELEEKKDGVVPEKKAELLSFITKQQRELEAANTKFANELKQHHKSLESKHQLLHAQILATEMGRYQSRHLWRKVGELEPEYKDIEEKEIKVFDDDKLAAMSPEEKKNKIIPGVSSEQQRYEARLSSILKKDDGLYEREGSSFTIEIKDGKVRPLIAVHKEDTWGGLGKGNWDRFDAAYTECIQFLKQDPKNNQLTISYSDPRHFNLEEFDRLVMLAQQNDMYVEIPEGTKELLKKELTIKGHGGASQFSYGEKLKAIEYYNMQKENEDKLKKDFPRDRKLDQELKTVNLSEAKDAERVNDLLTKHSEKIAERLAQLEGKTPDGKTYEAPLCDPLKVYDDILTIRNDLKLLGLGQHPFPAEVKGVLEEKVTKLEKDLKELLTQVEGLGNKLQNDTKLELDRKGAASDRKLKTPDDTIIARSGVREAFIHKLTSKEIEEKRDECRSEFGAEAVSPKRQPR